MDRPSCPKLFCEAIAGFSAVFLEKTFNIEPFECNHDLLRQLTTSFES